MGSADITNVMGTRLTSLQDQLHPVIPEDVAVYKRHKSDTEIRGGPGCSNRPFAGLLISRPLPTLLTVLVTTKPPQPTRQKRDAIVTFSPLVRYKSFESTMHLSASL